MMGYSRGGAPTVPKAPETRYRQNGLAGENPRAQVTITAVADNEDNGRVLNFLSESQRDDGGTGRRNATEQPFLARQTSGHLLGLRLRDLLNAIDERLLPNRRDIGRRPLAYSGNRRSVGRLGADNHDLRFLRCQLAGYDRDGAGRAHRRYKMGDAALRVAPYFWARRLIVGHPIVIIRKLI